MKHRANRTADAARTHAFSASRRPRVLFFKDYMPHAHICLRRIFYEDRSTRHTILEEKAVATRCETINVCV
ncbi:hypothetical protein Y032_0464g1921 [Ancylostoma ceylanicum]|nr:hypothetical protein Y032_0464g1921 [Ancylostoma ceylanicum]